MNIDPIIIRKKIEDFRQLGAFMVQPFGQLMTRERGGLARWNLWGLVGPTPLIVTNVV
jgi:hypothetical protein